MGVVDPGQAGAYQYGMMVSYQNRKFFAVQPLGFGAEMTIFDPSNVPSSQLNDPLKIRFYTLGYVSVSAGMRLSNELTIFSGTAQAIDVGAKLQNLESRIEALEAKA